MPIAQFATDPKLLNLSLSLAQRTLLKAYNAEPLTDEEADMYMQCVGVRYEPIKRLGLTCIAGVRSGKSSRVGTTIALYQACMRDHSYLSAGEVGVVLIIAQDARGGQTTLNYIRACIENSPLLRGLVKGDMRKSEIELRNNCVIAVYPCNYRAPRSLTIICAILEEAAFWRDEDSANPDVEILRSVRRGMALVPDPKLVVISTPYGKSGILYDDYVKRHELTDTLVWTAPSWVMNPSISPRFLDKEREKDPISFAREYGGEFTEDVSALISAEVVAAAVRDYRELPPQDGVTYFASMDSSLGGTSLTSDAFTGGVAHRDGERLVLDWVQGWRAQKPEDIVAEIAARMRPYRISKITGDKFSGAWVRDACAKHGLTYEYSQRTRSELYLEVVPLLNQQRVDLPNNHTLIKELRGLERKTSRSGSGRDAVDHRPREHDDFANAAAIAIVMAAQKSGSIAFFVGGTQDVLVVDGVVTYADPHLPFAPVSTAPKPEPAPVPERKSNFYTREN